MTKTLNPNYDSRKSFYGKAEVITDGNTIKLKSYNTIVAKIENNQPIVFDTYSNTTLRHIKEFLRQYGFKAETKQQIMADYMC